MQSQLNFKHVRKATGKGDSAWGKLSFCYRCYRCFIQTTSYRCYRTLEFVGFMDFKFDSSVLKTQVQIFPPSHEKTTVH